MKAYYLLALVLLSTLVEAQNSVNQVGFQVSGIGLVYPEYQRTIFPKVKVLGIIGLIDASLLPRVGTENKYSGVKYEGGGFLGTGTVYHFYTFGKKKKKHKKHKNTHCSAFAGFKLIGGKTNATIRDHIHSQYLGTYFAEKDFGLVNFYRHELTIGLEINIKGRIDLQLIPFCIERGATWKEKRLAVRDHPLHNDSVTMNMQLGLHYRW